MTTPKTVEALAKELRIVANMINTGEKIRWGQETALMDEAADMLTTLTHHHEEAVRKAVEEERERVVQLLKDIGEQAVQDLWYIHRTDFEQALTPTTNTK